MSNVPSLLPPNSTKLERSLEQVTAGATNLPVPIRDICDPDLCPEALLPWLAWAEGVDEWDPAWTVAQKRTAIRNVRQVHSHRGTPGAVDLALQVLPYDAHVIEWFERTPPRRPYTFSVLVQLPAEADESAGNPYALAERMVQRPKNLRSKLDSIDVSSTRELPLYFAAASAFGATCWVYPRPPPAELLDELSGEILDEAGDPLLAEDITGESVFDESGESWLDEEGELLVEE